MQLRAFLLGTVLMLGFVAVLEFVAHRVAAFIKPLSAGVRQKVEHPGTMQGVKTGSRR